MTDKVLCPWCGAEMKRDWRQTDYGEPSREVWFACENCKSNSPIAWGENYDEALKTATEYALRRYTPPLKPMTWDEFVRMTHPRLDGTEYPPVYVETAKAYSGRQGSWIIAKPNAIRVDTRYKPNRAFVDAHCVNLDALAYGKTWRCWERKPTEEERRAAGWET